MRPARPGAGLWTAAAVLVLVVLSWGGIVQRRHLDGIWVAAHDQRLVRIRHGRVDIRERDQTGWRFAGRIGRDEDGAWWFAVSLDLDPVLATPGPAGRLGPREAITPSADALHLGQLPAIAGPWRWSWWRSLFVW